MNLGEEKCTKEVRISVHLSESQKSDMIRLLREYIDVLVWVNRDMLGIITSVVSHEFPINPRFSPPKQKTRKFKPGLLHGLSAYFDG